MSVVYNLEPPTKGKVVLRTTIGDIDIELWPKEAPKAVRNFAQLCLEGYYDNTVFHRIIKDFMVQGGDPTGTGDAGDSIYGHPFKDEFHSRLKFSHRGLIACANQNKPDTNGSQFFMTLDRTDHLDRKSTIFGKITGDTIYNLLHFNDLEVDEDDRPVDPPRLIRADVLDLPFDDIKPRVDREAKEAAAAAEKARKEAEAKQKSKASRNFKLISFGDEAEEEEMEAEEASKNLKIKSAHDALEDEKLSKEAALEIDLEKVRAAMREAKAAKSEPQQGGENKSMAEKMRDRILGKRKAEEEEELQTRHDADEQAKGENNQQRAPSDDKDDDDDNDDEDDTKRGSYQERDVIAGLTRGTKKSSAAVVAPSKQIKVQNADLLTNWEKKRMEYKERKRLGGHREKDTLAKLKQFQSKMKGGTLGSLSAKPSTAAPNNEESKREEAPEGLNKKEDAGGYSGQVRQDIDHKMDMPAAWRVDSYLQGEAEVDDGLDGLLGHKLEFVQTRNDGKSAPDEMDDYVVHDPLLEAGKAKFNKQKQKDKKKTNEWAGRSRD